MDSSFLTSSALTVMNAGLALYSGILFIKMMIQFGLPNHPARFSAYLLSFCVAFYFTAKALVDFNILTPWFWMEWRTLPMVIGGFGLLMQAILAVCNFGHLQQKVISRVPLIAGLVCMAIFKGFGEIFLIIGIVTACIFLTISVGKARHQKRIFFKMSLFLGLFALLQLPQIYWLHIFSQILLFFGVFYFFLFEHTIGVGALIDSFKASTEGES